MRLQNTGSAMARIAWRRTLHLLQQQQRSLLPPLAATSRSSAAPLSEELCNRTSSWALSTREAHFSSRDHLSGGYTQVCGSRIGDNWGLANGRRNLHATGVQHMARQNSDDTSGLQNAEEINSAFRELVKKWTLDVDKLNADAGEKLKEMARAYEALNDDEKRAVDDKVFLQAVSRDGGRGGFRSTDNNFLITLVLLLVIIGGMR